MKTIHFIGGAALLALGLGGVWLTREPRVVEATPRTPDPTAPPAPTFERSARPCLLAPHTRLAYELSTRTHATIDAQRIGVGHAELPASNEGEFHSTLQLEAVASLDDGSLMLARLVGVDAITSRAAPGVSETGFLFRLSTACEVTAFARHRSAPLAAARTQQATLAQLWFRVPRTTPEPAAGENSLGQFRAVLAQDGQSVQRRIVSYEQAWGNPQTPIITDSFLAAQVTEGPWFDELKAHEVVSQGVFSTASVDLFATRATFDDSVLAQLTRNENEYVWEDLLPRVVLPTASKERTPQERAALAALVDKPFDEAVREFAAKVVAEPNTDAKWRGLARYFTVHPEKVRDFVGSMQRPDFPGELKALGFVAVGHAEAPEARDALLAVRDDTQAAPFDRVRASLALVGRDDVGADLAKKLHSDSKAMLSEPNSARGFYGRNALLALGMFSALRQNEDSAVTREARAGISEALDASNLNEGPSIAFMAAMGAMGNLGDPGNLPTIVELSKHPNPDVRAQVPQAMRRLHQKDVAQFTLDWLQRETSPDVKKELYSVIQHQLLDDQTVASEALSRQAVSDLTAQPDLLTRQPLVRILAPNASKYDFVRQALVAQAVKEVGSTSGLYSVIAQYVPGDDVSAALAQRSGSRVPPASTSTGVTP